MDISCKTKLTVALLMALSTGTAYASEKDKHDDPFTNDIINLIEALYSCPVYAEFKVTGGVIEKSQTSHLSFAKGILVIQEHIIDADAANVSGGRIINDTRIIDNTVRLTLSELSTVLYVMGNDAVIECNQSACIHGSAKEDSKMKPIETKSWHMNFCDADKAQRAALAMQHLIERSRGNKSPF